MKKFETPAIEVTKMEVADVIAASFGEEDNGGGWA